MNIGLSSACFYPDVNTEGTIRVMKNLGFNCGEIFLNSLCEYEDDFIDILKNEVEANDFKVISVHAFCSPFEPFLFDKYERRRKDLLNIFKKVCRAGQRLGAKYYTFHGMRAGLYKELDKSFIVDIYDELLYTSAEIGITLCQENVSWCMSSDLDFLGMLTERCRYPINFTLDIKQAYKAETEPEEYIKVMKNRIRNIHINDRNEKKVCLLPGKGSVDYNEFFKALKNVGYQGDSIIEVYGENFSSPLELSEAKKYIESFSKIF